MRAFKNQPATTDNNVTALVISKNPVQISIPLSKLFLNEIEVPYQRDPQARLAWLKKNIAKKFSMDDTGVFYVSARLNDRYAIMDGGGRWYVMTYLLPQYKDALVRCLVWEGLTIAEEAAIFASQRNKKSITPVDYFNSDVHRRVPEAVEIKQAMDRLGLKVGSSWPRGISSVPYLYGMHRMGVLERTVFILKNTCNTRLSNMSIIATAIFIEAAGRGLKEDRLRSILVKHGGNYFETQVKIAAGGIRLHPVDMYDVIAKHILKAYNSGLQTGKGKIDIEKIEKAAALFTARLNFGGKVNEHNQ